MPYCASKLHGSRGAPVGRRAGFQPCEHLFCDSSRTWAKSCAYRLHTMPVAPKGVLPCAAQPLGRLSMGRTMGDNYCETDEY